MNKALSEIAKDPRVDSVSDETSTGDGYWIYLKAGWRSRDDIVHVVHEWRVKDLQAAFREIRPCDCKDCGSVASELPAFRVYLANGTNYVTSMAKDVTLADAKEYFLGKELVQADEKTMVKVVAVEQM